MLYAGLVQFSASAPFEIPDGNKIVNSVDPMGSQVAIQFTALYPYT